MEEKLQKIQGRYFFIRMLELCQTFQRRNEFPHPVFSGRPHFSVYKQILARV